MVKFLYVIEKHPVSITQYIEKLRGKISRRPREGAHLANKYLATAQTRVMFSLLLGPLREEVVKSQVGEVDWASFPQFP